MKISSLKRQARSALKGNWGKGVLVTFLMLFFSAFIPTVMEIMLSGGFSEWSDPNAKTPASSSITGFIITIAVMPLSVAAYWFYLALVRSESANVAEIFNIYKDGKKSFKVIGASILVSIFSILWALLLIIPGIIKSISYSQTYFILKDKPEFSVLEAITESRNLMKGYKWKFFLMNLSFIGWAFLSIFTLFIGLLWLIPYISATTASFYHDITTKQSKGIL